MFSIIQGEKHIHCKVALIKREAKLRVSGTGDTEQLFLLQSLLNYLHEVELCKKGGSRLTSLPCFPFPTLCCSLVANPRLHQQELSLKSLQAEEKTKPNPPSLWVKGKAFSCSCFVNIAVHFLCLLHSSSKPAHLVLDLLDCSFNILIFFMGF